MIDIANEHLRPLSKASAEVPGRPHTSTVVRWARHGVRGVKLESVAIGGRRFTSAEAVARFLSRLNERGSISSTSLSQKRQQEIAREEAELDAAGIR
jgi:hypothetical protein